MSNHFFNDTWVFAEFGTILPGNALNFPVGPYNAAGTLALNSSGNYTLDSKEMRNGEPFDTNISGNYTVNGDAVTFYFQGMPVAYIILTKNRQEGRGLSLINGMNKTYLVVRQ